MATTRSRRWAPVGPRWGRRDAKLAHLADTTVGRGLSRIELQRLGARADVVTLPPGTSVVVGADRFTYVLAGGSLAVSIAGEATPAVRPGDKIPPGSLLALSEVEILVL